MTGYSPFQGETHQETFLNVTMCDYDFDDEMFDVVSQEAKEFIEKLLIVAPRYSVNVSERENVSIWYVYSYACVRVCVA